MNKKKYSFALICFTSFPGLTSAQNTPAPAKDKDWVIQSNRYTKLIIDIDEKYSPEFGTQQGLAFYNTLV